MKRFFSVIFGFFVWLNLSASAIDEIEISKKGQTIVGLGVGTPSFNSGASADIPCFSAFAVAGIASGFLNSDVFGSNGAVDLGVNFSACHYSEEYGLYYTKQKVKVFQGAFTVRSAFHFQFLKQFDTYVGLCGGVNICAEGFQEQTIYSEKSDFDHWNQIESNAFSPVFGAYVGTKWFFTRHFALGLEASYDFLKTNDDKCEEAYGRSHYGGSALPVISVGASFILGKD